MADEQAPTKSGLVRAVPGLSKQGLLRTGGKLTDLGGGNWKELYTDGTGNVAELALGAMGYAMVSTGASAAPTMQGVWAPKVVTVAF